MLWSLCWIPRWWRWSIVPSASHRLSTTRGERGMKIKCCDFLLVSSFFSSLILPCFCVISCFVLASSFASSLLLPCFLLVSCFILASSLLLRCFLLRSRFFLVSCLFFDCDCNSTSHHTPYSRCSVSFLSSDTLVSKLHSLIDALYIYYL